MDHDRLDKNHTAHLSSILNCPVLINNNKQVKGGYSSLFFLVLYETGL